MNNPRSNSVNSVVKAFTLLNCFVRANRVLSLTELSEMTGWPKSTVHGLLSALYTCGAVTQLNHNGRYALGVRLFELGNTARLQWNILETARPYMEKISTEVGESTCLGMFDDDSVLILDCLDFENPMRIVSNAGTRLPLHASALGKAITAFLPESAAVTAVLKAGLTQYTPHTIVDKDALIPEWGRIREVGSAIENGEQRIGMRCVAAPIFDCFGTPRYAIAVTGMFRRISEEPFLKAQALVTEAAKSITKLMEGA